MKKNFFYNIIYQILILILPLITIPYVSRTIGAKGIGIYSYTYSIAYYFMIFAMLGLNNYGNRVIAKIRDDKEKLSKEFCSIYSLQLITSTAMVVLYFLYTIIFDVEYKVIGYIQIIYVIASMFDINWFFFGMEKFKLTITRNIFIKVLSLILIFIFVKNADDVWKYTLILAGCALFSNIMLFKFLHKYIEFVKVTKKDVAKHLKPCLVLFLPVIAVSLYKIMDKIMLGIFTDVKEVGYYENGEKITQVPLTIITALGTVSLPRVSNMLANNEEDKVKKLLDKTMPFVMFLTLPMALGMVAIGKDFSILFFGNEFEKSGYIIQLLSITILFLAWGNVIRTEYLIPKEKDKEYIISAFLGAIINFIINILLIPLYKSIGACIGTIIAEFTVMFYQSWKVKNELPLMNYIKKSVGFGIKSIIMFGTVILIGKFKIINPIIKILLQIISGILVYVILNIKYIFDNLKINGKLESLNQSKANIKY